MTLIWDWNGTLLDDTQASVDALNDQLVQRGLDPVSVAFYRERFAFPVRSFYALCGVDLAREDWNALAQDYHDAYHRHARDAQLAASAREALNLAQCLGCRQAIVSALRQDYLDAAVGRFGIRGYFDAVIGTDNLDGGSKLDRARAFVATLSSRSPAPDSRPSFVCIGDSLHDKEVADALGARCILYSGGSHAPERLARAAPVAETLTEAVRLALAQGDSSQCAAVLL